MMRTRKTHLHAGMFAALIAATPAYAAEGRALLRAQKHGAFAAGMLFATPAFAETEGESGGLPQLDFATWPTQLFWLVITFTLAYFAMAKLVLPRIAGVLEQRHTRISDDMLLARRASEDAEKTRKAVEAELDAARSKAAGITRDAAAEAKAQSDAGLAEAAKKLNAEGEAAEARIREARDAALKEVDGIAAGLALEAAARLAGVSVSEAEAAAAISRAATGNTQEQ